MPCLSSAGLVLLFVGAFLHKVSSHYSTWDYHIMRLKWERLSMDASSGWRFSTDNLKAWQQESGYQTLTKQADAIKQLHALQDSKFFILSICCRSSITSPLSQALLLPQGRYGIGIKKKNRKEKCFLLFEKCMFPRFMAEIWDSKVIQEPGVTKSEAIVSILSSSHNLPGTATLSALSKPKLTSYWQSHGSSQCTKPLPSALPSGMRKVKLKRLVLCCTSLRQFRLQKQTNKQACRVLATCITNKWASLHNSLSDVILTTYCTTR